MTGGAPSEEPSFIKRVNQTTWRTATNQRGNNEESSGTFAHQCVHNCHPLRFEGACRHRFAGASIPIGGVGLVAFLTMQIGVDPSARPVLLLLGALVGRVPVSLGVVPQCLQGQAE